MALTDGFNKANSFAEMANTEFVAEVTHQGVTCKAFIQECQGLAEHGEHGWFHVGVDLVDDDGKVLDSIPVHAGGDEEHEGHFKGREGATARANKAIAEFTDTYNRSVDVSREMGRELTDELWKQGFVELKQMREEMARFNDMMMAMLLGADDDDSDPVDALAKLLGLNLDDDSDDDTDDRAAALLGDFDPDVVEPTDEGYDDK